MGGNGWFESLLLLLIVGVYVLAPVFRIHASFVLYRAWKYSKEHGIAAGAVGERLFVAATGAVAVIIIAILGMLRVAFNIILPSPLGPVLTAVSLILLVLPAFVWEYMYLTGRLER